jgi:hypothetical protein
MNFTRFHKPQLSALIKGVLLFPLVSGLLIAVDQLSVRCGLNGWQRIGDDFLGGLIAGLIFYLYECHRMQRFIEHLRMIDLMNHHIRNALQPLMFLEYQSEGKAILLVETCVQQIDWALREVLPGKTHEQFGVDTNLRKRNGITLASPAANQPAEMVNVQRGTAVIQPKPFFSHWLDTWRTRNDRAS